MKEIDYYNLMKGFESEEIEPMVGIFWYLPEEHRLFEVHASSLSQSKMVNGHTTYSKLHKTIWQAKKCRDRAKGKETSVYYQDYTRIPRGRIFYDNGKFIVKVGSWYKQYWGSASEVQKGAYRNVEGKQMLVPYRGSIKDTLREMQEDLQSSISYAGGRDLESIRRVDYVIVKNSIMNGDY